MVESFLCRPLENLAVEGLVRLWAHEALRLFQDRLVEDSERRWTNENIDIVALKHFPGVDKDAALSRPILYSNWLSKDYIPVDREELRDYVKARLKVRVQLKLTP
jgi:dynein heavy chain 1